MYSSHWKCLSYSMIAICLLTSIKSGCDWIPFFWLSPEIIVYCLKRKLWLRPCQVTRFLENWIFLIAQCWSYYGIPPGLFGRDNIFILEIDSKETFFWQSWFFKLLCFFNKKWKLLVFLIKDLFCNKYNRTCKLMWLK